MSSDDKNPSAASLESQPSVVPAGFAGYSFISIDTQEEVGSCERKVTVSSDGSAQVAIHVSGTVDPSLAGLKIQVSDTIVRYLAKLKAGTNPPEKATTDTEMEVETRKEWCEKVLSVAYNMLIEGYWNMKAGTEAKDALLSSKSAPLSSIAFKTGRDFGLAVELRILGKGWHGC